MTTKSKQEEIKKIIRRYANKNIDFAVMVSSSSDPTSCLQHAEVIQNEIDKKYVDEIQSLINSECLALLEKVKGKKQTAGIIQKDSGLRLDIDWVALSAIEEIEQEYK